MDPTTLFSYERHVDSRALHGRTLLVTLGAFTDAGDAQRLLDDHLLNTLSSRVVGRVDMDQVHDYAGRRPEVTLQLDHFDDYEKPEILLHEVTDEEGQTFFLLTGPEPSFQWERVASALRIVVEQLGIERTLLLQGFPAPVPHTRELPVTRFAGDPESIAVRRTMPGTFRLRAPFTALLTMRLDEGGLPSAPSEVALGTMNEGTWPLANSAMRCTPTPAHSRCSQVPGRERSNSRSPRCREAGSSAASHSIRSASARKPETS